MNFLITGASGFIGSNMVKRLAVSNQTNVIALTKKEVSSQFDTVKNVLIDILNKDKLRDVFMNNKIDCVIHLAAITEHNAVVNEKINTLMTNFMGTKNLLELFNEYCSDALFIYASSGKVYGKTNEMPISENAVCNPINILGKSKYMTEKLIDYCAEMKNKNIICRIFNVYGWGQKPNFVIPTIMRQLGEKEIVLGNITDKRDYIYLDDLIDALIRCVESKNRFQNVDVINIGSGISYSVKEIMKIIEDIFGRKIIIKVDKSKYRSDETSIEYCVNKKISDMTGWRTTYSMYDGIKQMLALGGWI